MTGVFSKNIEEDGNLPPCGAVFLYAGTCSDIPSTTTGNMPNWPHGAL
jgi:hypothetical protein